MVDHSKHSARRSDVVYHAPVIELHSLFLYYHIPQDLARNDPGIVKRYYGKSIAMISFQIDTQSRWSIFLLLLLPKKCHHRKSLASNNKRKRVVIGVYEGTSWNFLNKFFSRATLSNLWKKLIQKISRSSLVNTCGSTLF